MFVAAAYSSFGQSQNWWRVNGNTPSASDYLGTQNNTPLIIKTNNTERARFTEIGWLGVGTSSPTKLLDVNGQSRFRLKVQCDSLLEASMLKITGLSGGAGLLNVNATGNVNKILYTGNASDVLTGAGTFTSLNALLPSQLWQQNASGIYYNGNVGINKNNPQFALDITGDLNVSHNVYVGGGVVIAQRANLDTADFGSGRRIAGNGNAVEVIGDFRAQNKLEVMGNAIFNGQLTGTQGFMFDAGQQLGMKYIGNSNSSGGTFYYGKAIPPVNITPCALLPSSLYNHNFGGNLQVFPTDNNGNYTSGGLVNIQTYTNGTSSIDASIGGVINPSLVNSGGLLLNYFCGLNTYINTGTLGGIMFVGEKASFARNVGIGNNYPNHNFDSNVGLNIYANDNNMDGIRLNIWNGSVRAIHVVNPGNNQSNFVVMQDGKTHIGNQKQVSGPHTDAMLTVNGKIVGKACYIRVNDWADYVFDRDYKLMNLEELENYVMEHKHLPGVPSEKEVLEQGIETGEMNKILLKKIEELTLYLIELKKELRK